MNQAGTNQDTTESLSAGMDGELSAEQLRFLLRRLDHDVSLQQAWDRYHVARDGMRRELPAVASAGFSARVMDAIGQESRTSAMPRRSHWLRWSAGGAIAASVAAAALMIGSPSVGENEYMAASPVEQASDAALAATPSDKPRPVAPASVPPWLSGNSAGLLSQQASATLGAPFGQARPAYARRLSGYPAMPRYRTLDNNDGSYLLLLDPDQRNMQDTSRRASVSTP